MHLIWHLFKISISAASLVHFSHIKVNSVEFSQGRSAIFELGLKYALKRTKILPCLTTIIINQLKKYCLVSPSLNFLAIWRLSFQLCVFPCLFQKSRHGRHCWGRKGNHLYTKDISNKYNHNVSGFLEKKCFLLKYFKWMVDLLSQFLLH